MISSRPVRAAVPCLVSILLTACGASYQAVFDGDVHFERCYRLDAEPTRSRDERLTCWNEWTQRYTHGQTADRVDYANGRARTLSAGDVKPVGPSMVPPAPPPVASASASGVVTVASLVDDPSLSTRQLCFRDCGDQFSRCASKCDRTSCVKKCGDIVKLCVGECL